MVSAGLSTCSSSQSVPSYVESGCAPADRGGRSVARVWDETVLDMFRQIIPAPTVNARNLFHVSAAMWDAWAAYDPTATGYFVKEKHTAGDVAAAREAAISYAAYRLLLWRFGTVSDLAAAPDQLAGVMHNLCYRSDYEASNGDGPADLGNRIGAVVIDYGATDGALEDDRYADSSFIPVNAPLVVAEAGTVMRDPNAWQPLQLGKQIAQNGLPIAGTVQSYVGHQWQNVSPFALAPATAGAAIDPGPPPRLGDPETDQAFKDAAITVLRDSSELDTTDGVTIDISPAAIGDNTLGTNDGNGHATNPATGKPYEPNVVPRADFLRALAEYWADGPHSETPPGHWNLIANQAQDAPGFVRRIGGQGPELDPLEWDVKTYFALNAALHDAAIAAWGLKAEYDSVRPISMIRYLGGKGQSSDPGGPSFDPEGLPLVPGLVEVITAESSTDGQRHADLAEHIGEIAVLSWRGQPKDPKTELGGVGWVLALNWVPYQRATFVTPAFPGWVSGHSTFSRAGAEVLTALTGSAYFPGGLYQWKIGEGSLIHEQGPTAPFTFQWATYADAADLAGISRLYGGIHIPEDDFQGRLIGAQVGTAAWELAQRYFAGVASS